MTGTPKVADWGDQRFPLRLEERQPLNYRPGQDVIFDRLWTYSHQHAGFYGWLRVVHRRMARTAGVTLLDLPDRNWRDEYDGRVPPQRAADVALDEAAAVFGIDEAR